MTPAIGDVDGEFVVKEVQDILLHEEEREVGWTTKLLSSLDRSTLR